MMQFRQRLDDLARYFILVGVFFIPASPSLTAAMSLGTFLALFGQEFWRHARVVWQYSSTYALILLLFLLAIGVFINPYDTQHAVHNFLKYLNKLVMLLILIPLFFAVQWRRYALNVLLGSVSFFVMLILLHEINFIDLNHWLGQDHYGLTISAIPFSFLVCFSLYIAINRIMDEKTATRWWYLALVVLWVYFLLFINMQRTAYVLFMGLGVLILTQRMGWRGGLLALIVLPLLAGIFYWSSSAVQLRFAQAGQDMSHYQAGEVQTSLGLRVHFLEKSAELIAQRPWFGHGTGSFIEAYKSVSNVFLTPEETSLGDPHSMYAHLAVQLGFVGLAVFILWLALLVKDSFALPKPEQYLAQGLLLCFIVGGSLFEDALLRSKIASLVILFLAILFSAREAKPTNA